MNVAATGQAPAGPAQPHNIEIEQALLGACLIRPSCLDEVTDTVEPEHFFAALHGRIFGAMRDLHGKGEVINPLKLRSHFAADPDTKELGGPNYIQQLAIDAPSLINATDMARAVKALAIRRSIIAQAQAVIADATSCPMGDTASAMIERAEAAMAAVRLDAPTINPVLSVGQAAMEAVRITEAARKNPERAGVQSGIGALDDAMGPLFPGDMIVLGGATSMGKTALAQQIAWGAATAGHPVLFFSLEMAAEELAARYLSQQLNIGADRLESGRIDSAQMVRAIDAAEAMASVPITIDPGARLSVPQMRARARHMKVAKGIRLIVIDHLRFIAADERRAPEIEQIQQVTRDVKAMAKELGVPVLLLAHLNRELWKRASRKPMLSDLFGASAIEQNADVVMFVHREEYFLQREMPGGSDSDGLADWNMKMQLEKGMADLLVAKRRRGACRNARLKFEAETTRFSDPAQDAKDNVERLL